MWAVVVGASVVVDSTVVDVVVVCDNVVEVS